MHPTSLERLARQLTDGLRGEHDAFCRELVRLLACGHPVTRERLATVLQMKVEQVAEDLASLADLEVDQSGNDVGWGLTFIPKQSARDRTAISAIRFCLIGLSSS
jgi:Helix-turn-helix domain of alkylmercury lyase